MNKTLAGKPLVPWVPPRPASLCPLHPSTAFLLGRAEALRPAAVKGHPSYRRHTEVGACRIHYQLMRKSRSFISSWFRGNMVPVIPEVLSPYSDMRAGSREVVRRWSFSNRLIVSTAKETLREDEGTALLIQAYVRGWKAIGRERGFHPHTWLPSQPLSKWGRMCHVRLL